MGFIDWAAWMMAMAGYDYLILTIASLSCGSSCNTYLGYYPWIP